MLYLENDFEAYMQQAYMHLPQCLSMFVVFDFPNKELQHKELMFNFIND